MNKRVSFCSLLWIYEISSFAKQDYQSIHNLKYWEDKEYLALGLGASSYFNNNEITNARQLNKLYQNIKKVNNLHIEGIELKIQ